MEKSEKQKKGKIASTSNKSYHKSPRKASGKSKKSRSEAAKKTAEKRAKRRENALKSTAIDHVLAKLGLVKDGSIVCPFCGGKNCLELDHEKCEFRCKSCRKKGNSFALVKRVKGITDWQAVAWMEENAKKIPDPDLPKGGVSSSSNSYKKKIDISIIKHAGIEGKSPLRAQEGPGEEFRERIERVKKFHRIEDVIAREASVSFKRAGSALMCRCPFSDHEDKTPSFSVQSEKGWFKCFGCGRKGDVIAFVQEYCGLSFGQALDHLEPSGAKACPETREKPVLCAEKSNPRSRVKAITAFRDFFHSRIGESAVVSDFLRKRGLFSHDLVSYFKLGFDDGRVNQAIGANIIGELKALGLLNGKDNSRFYQCLTVGLEDGEGNVVGLYGRRVNESKGSKHQLPKGKIEGIINARAFKSCKEMIITEGPLDAFSVWIMGLCNVSCVFSASSIPSSLVDLIVQNRTERLYLLLDNDPEGEKACHLLAKSLSAREIELLRPCFPEKIKDANELLVKLGKEKASACLRKMLEIAKPLEVSFFTKPIPTPVPGNSLEIPTKINEEEIELFLEDRRYRVRGFAKNLSFDSLRINLGVFLAGRFHVDTLELYNARQRMAFAKTAAKELVVKYELIKRDVGRILLKLESLQTKAIEKEMEPKQKIPPLSDEERAEALALLENPGLMQKISEDFKLCGLVGEEENCQITYLAFTSRQLDDPIALLIQALSGAGKTALMDAALTLMPPEQVVKYTGVSGQSLFYFGEDDLVHKILAIAEDEGAQNAAYPLKILQSEKELTMASTAKNPKTGRFTALEYKVNGPASIVISTTREVVDQELVNRFFVLTSNQGRAQTREIHQSQRAKESIDAIVREIEKERIVKLHQNAQRLLRPMKIVNPYAKYLTFPDTQLRTRRDHPKYLTLIRTIAFLHQYQREIKRKKHKQEVIEYIEVTLEDIEIANRLVSHVLGTSLDELAPQTRKLLGLITRMVDEACEKDHVKQEKYKFTRREVREYTGWCNTEIKRHLDQLEDFEYLVVHRGSWGRQYRYELVYKKEGENGQRFLPGLVDVKKLRSKLEKA